MPAGSDELNSASKVTFLADLEAKFIDTSLGPNEMAVIEYTRMILGLANGKNAAIVRLYAESPF